VQSVSYANLPSRKREYPIRQPEPIKKPPFAEVFLLAVVI